MKKFILLVLISFSFTAFSQEDAIVYFSGKPLSATFLANPLSMLSQRSLDRRTAQNIALNFTDVPVHQSYFDQVATSSGIQLLAKSKWLNCVYVRGSQSDIAALSSLPFVTSISFLDPTLNLTNPNSDSETSNRKTSLIPVNKRLETLTTFNYGNSFNQIHMLNGDILHQQNYTGTGKIIAVLDAGFPEVDTAQPFERLLSNNSILGGYDFVNKSTDFYTGNSHGTLVLSCMGGYTDGQLVGTAPDAKYYLYITEDVASENPVEEANWVEAAEEADRVGVDIITTSLGYLGYDNPAYSHNYSDMIGNKNFASKGVNMAFSKGIIVVASAGNEGSNPEPHVGVPGEATNALAIGAVKFDRARANFSSIGPSFDGRIKPDIMAQGQASVLSDTLGNITTADGTSFSGPIMAGMIASFWQALPTLTNQQVVNLVKQSADNFATPDALYGYGIPNFGSALSTALGNKYVSNQVFAIYPNPTKDFVSVTLPENSKNILITFYNQLGQQVFNKNVDSQNSKLEIQNLSSGIYLYQIEGDNFSKTGKLVKR
jgi:serine protease AprX